MNPILDLSLRLLAAGLIGSVIGYERELRSKGAGIRTHVLVSLGSCLFMIISLYGFKEAVRFDAARVAAGVVGGLGFLGGGIIMKTKNHVSGLTTAAGIWVTGAIGLAVGCGMFEVAGICSVLVLVILEALNYYTVRLGEKELSVTLSSEDRDALMSAVKSLGKRAKGFAVSRQNNRFHAELTLRIPKRDYNHTLLEKLSAFPGVELDNLE